MLLFFYDDKDDDDDDDGGIGGGIADIYSVRNVDSHADLTNGNGDEWNGGGARIITDPVSTCTTPTQGLLWLACFADVYLLVAGKLGVIAWESSEVANVA